LRGGNKILGELLTLCGSGVTWFSWDMLSGKGSEGNIWKKQIWVEDLPSKRSFPTSGFRSPDVDMILGRTVFRVCLGLWIQRFGVGS